MSSSSTLTFDDDELLVFSNHTDHVVNPSPELNASYPSRMTFAWFDGTIKRGWKNPIKEENLHDVNPDSSCKKVMADWTRFWNFQYQRKIKDKDDDSSFKPKMTILPTMFLTFGTTYLLAGTNRLITILVQQVCLLFMCVLQLAVVVLMVVQFCMT